MPKDYTIKIVGRGEEIVYESDGKRYVFDVNFSSNPYKLYADNYSREDLGFLNFDVTDDERVILERISDWLVAKDGNPVQIIDKEDIPPRPLRSVDDILRENLNRRQNQ